MELGMRRHNTLPDGRKDDPPGSTNYTNAYGSAIHGAIHLVETQGMGNENAIQHVWEEFGGYLDPEERAMLEEDLQAYRGDTPPGMELVAAEVDVRVPLFIHNGEQIYFRFKLDALYRRKDNHTVFYHRDYKSSKHRRTQQDVDSDLQMWCYNWGIYEMYVECVALRQSYEQLRFGNLTTAKNAEQRAQVKVWLIDTIRAILEDDKMEPKQNQFCPWCPLVVTCDQTVRASRYWKGRLAALAPMVKEGRRTKLAFGDEADDIEHMVQDVLPRAIETRKHLAAVEAALKDLIERMPSEERERLGWRTFDRKTKDLPPDGLKAIHEAMGDTFYEAVSLSKGAVEKLAEPTTLELVKQQELEKVSSTGIAQTSS
jgi:hypothetical protein